MGRPRASAMRAATPIGNFRAPTSQALYVVCGTPRRRAISLWVIPARRRAMTIFSVGVSSISTPTSYAAAPRPSMRLVHNLRKSYPQFTESYPHLQVRSGASSRGRAGADRGRPWMPRVMVGGMPFEQDPYGATPSPPGCAGRPRCTVSCGRLGTSQGGVGAARTGVAEAAGDGRPVATDGVRQIATAVVNTHPSRQTMTAASRLRRQVRPAMCSWRSSTS